jgi:hypothetical protein
MPLTTEQRARRKAARPALQAIASMLVDAIRIAIADVGLDGSALQASIEAEVKNGDTVTAYMIEYGQWVISGRRKFVKKVPIAALIDWIQRKGITPTEINGKTISTNQLAFAIQNGIFKNGIKGRDFITPAVTDDFIELAQQMVLDALVTEVEEVLIVV